MAVERVEVRRRTPFAHGYERIDGVLLFRVESSLVYFNVEHVLRAVLERVRASAVVKLVVQWPGTFVM